MNRFIKHTLRVVGVFVRIRIYWIGGIFRISLRPARLFAITENPAKTNTDKRFPIE